MTLKGALVRIIEYWPHLPDTKGVPCPAHFTDVEMDGSLSRSSCGLT